jgi:hypothetical protein
MNGCRFESNPRKNDAKNAAGNEAMNGKAADEVSSKCRCFDEHEGLANLSPKRIILLMQPEGLFSAPLRDAKASVDWNPTELVRIGDYAR